jgi:Fic family protein
VALQLGLPYGGVQKSQRHVEGLVSSLLDAAQRANHSLTVQRLCGWHASLFPTGYSGMIPIRVGKWRGESPMQVVSGPIGREKVHFEAPPVDRVSAEIYCNSSF